MIEVAPQLASTQPFIKMIHQELCWLNHHQILSIANLIPAENALETYLARGPSAGSVQAPLSSSHSPLKCASSASFSVAASSVQLVINWLIYHITSCIHLPLPFPAHYISSQALAHSLPFPFNIVDAARPLRLLPLPLMMTTAVSICFYTVSYFAQTFHFTKYLKWYHSLWLISIRCNPPASSSLTSVPSIIYKVEMNEH